MELKWPHQFRFNEEYGREVIRTAKPQPKGLLCRVGIHDLHFGYTQDGGGIRHIWCICLRCQRGKYQTSSGTEINTFG